MGQRSRTPSTRQVRSYDYFQRDSGVDSASTRPRTLPAAGPVDSEPGYNTVVEHLQCGTPSSSSRSNFLLQVLTPSWSIHLEPQRPSEHHLYSVPTPRSRSRLRHQLYRRLVRPVRTRLTLASRPVTNQRKQYLQLHFLWIETLKPIRRSYKHFQLRQRHLIEPQQLPVTALTRCHRA